MIRGPGNPFVLKRTLRSLIHLLAGLGAGLAILVSLAAWQLSKGPVSLGFVNQYIEDGLSAIHPKFSFQLEDTVLTWAGWERTLDVRILNVHILDEDKSDLAYLPEVSVALNARALVTGLVAPKRIELFGPSLLLVRNADGGFEFGFDGGADGGALVLKGMLGQMAAPPDRATAMSFLERVDVVDANVRIDDRATGRVWRAPSSQLKAWRADGLLHADLALNLSSEAAKAQVGIVGSLDPDNDRFEMGVTFSPLVPAAFADMADVMAPLKHLVLPMRGTVTVTARHTGDDITVESMGFDVHGAAGSVVLPDPLAQTLPVTGLTLRGHYEEAGHQLTLEEAAASLPDASHLTLPESLVGVGPHRLPLTALNLAGRFALAEGKVDLPTLSFDLDGASLRLALQADGVRSNGDWQGATVAIDGALHNVPMDRLKEYWPVGWGTDAWNWATAHMSEGAVKGVAAKARLKGGADGFEVVALNGTIDLDGLTVDYLSPLPPLTGASGHVTFDADTMDVDIMSGRADKLVLRHGKVRFTGLSDADQFADVTVTVDATVTDMLRFIDSEPLGFASAVGIDPRNSGGEASITLRLKFPLAKDLALGGVEVAANALLRDIDLPKVLFGLDMTDGTLNLRVDKEGMDVTGAVQLGPMPADFAWHQNFGGTDPVRAHYQVRGRADNVRDTRDLGFDLAPFPNEFIQGAVDVAVTFTEFTDGKADLVADLGLTDSVLNVGDIGWNKPAGVAGVARTHVLFDGERIAGIPEFSVKAGDMDIAGVARYAGDGTGLQRVDFDRVKFGRNDFAGALIALDSGGWQVVAHGASLDFTPLLKRLSSSADADDDLGRQAADLALTVTADLDRVWMAGDRYLGQVKGTIARANDAWQSIRIAATVGKAKDLKVILEAQGAGRRLLSVSASDAGAVLSGFGFYNNMTGGILALAGAFDDTKPGSPFAGKLRVTDFKIVNAPTIAHLVSIMALTGIVDALQGEGLSFQTLEVPMTFVEGVLSMKDARASGLSLGFTATGKVYWDAEIIAVDGTMVPAYALNSVFGKIPLLGGLLTGGEEGSGMFAATYSVQGPMEKPKVTVNPLSALAPGFLRNLFDLFTPSAEAPSQPSPAPDETPQAVPEQKESL